MTLRRHWRHPGSASKAARCAGAAATDAGAEFRVGLGTQGLLGSWAGREQSPGCRGVGRAAGNIWTPFLRTGLSFPGCAVDARTAPWAGSGSGAPELGASMLKLCYITQNRAFPCLGLSFPASQGRGLRGFVSPAALGGFAELG